MKTNLLTGLLILLLLGGCASLPDQPSQEDSDAQGLATVSVQSQQIIYDAQALALFRQANDNRENTTQAETMYLRAVAIDPAMEPAWFNLARLYLMTGQHQKLQSLVDAEAIAPVLSARLLNLAASSYKSNGQFSQAISRLQQAIAIDETHLASLANMAIMTDIYLHQPEDALPWYERYQQQLELQNQEDPRVINWIADVKQRTQR